jgi:hypothetical protein
VTGASVDVCLGEADTCLGGGDVDHLGEACEGDRRG